MTQSLPDIIAIYLIPCSELPANITESFRAHVPVSISSTLTPIEHYGKASCEAEKQFDNGGYSEKTVLQFSTNEEINQYPPKAFVITDAQGQSYIIGTLEHPFPMVEMTKSIDKETNVNNVKVTFIRQNSLVPCAI